VRVSKRTVLLIGFHRLREDAVELGLTASPLVVPAPPRGGHLFDGASVMRSRSFGELVNRRRVGDAVR
jgi:hypothetical protein